VNPKRIAVVGTGYVGCVSAACLAALGHQVTGLDRDEYKVDSILAGRSPFYEPGLEELVALNVDAGRLTARVRDETAIANADIVLICVGTPSLKNGDQDINQLCRAVAEVASCAASRTKPLIIAVRSTVYPGTCEEILMPMLAGTPCILVSNPEFLREGLAVKDFMAPGLLVLGGADPDAVRQVSDIYTGVNAKPQFVSLRTAELIKYVCNAFHAVKIAFANEVCALSETMGVDGAEVMATMCKDEKLNISTAYLRPGFAFGGSCLPKDLRALSCRARQADVGVSLLNSVLTSNAEHLKRAVDAVLNCGEAKVGIVGLAFKENTDDLRESPVLPLLEALIGKGRSVRVFDPHIRISELQGTNRRFVLESIPHIGRLMRGLDELLAWSDLLVIAQKPDPEVERRVHASNLPVLDLINGQFAITRREVARSAA
jgi:GDP-mannose 6-dehydrogenase